MKKILYIINEGLHKFTYEHTAGLIKAIAHADEPISLYVMRSDGYTGFSLAHNRGESNIFRLPDYAAFDGILLDFNSNFNAVTNADGASGAQYCIRAAMASGKPVISIANHMDGFYYVSIDNYAAMTQVIRHLHREIGLTDFWFAMGPDDNYENRIRTQALRDYCRETQLLFPQPPDSRQPGALRPFHDRRPDGSLQPARLSPAGSPFFQGGP